jgi:hypothetical protein
MAGNEFKISLVPELAGIGRFVPQELEPGDTASLLVDGDDWLDVAEFPKSIRESAELFRRLDIAAKQDKPSRLNPTDKVCIGIIDFDPRNTEEQKLTG